MNESLFPVERPASGEDARFTFSLTLDVADVLARHGYPDIAHARAGGDFVALRDALFGFLYGPATGHPSTVDNSADGPVDTVPCGFGCGYLAECEADLNHHEHDECENRFAPLPDDPAPVPAPRPVRSIGRHTRRAHQQHSGGVQS